MKTTQLALYGAIVLAMALTACRDSSADPAHHAGTTAASGSVDGRSPVPLSAMMAVHQKRDMRDHLRVVQEITAALGANDFDAIAASAARIGWSEQQAAKCKHMGAGAPGFAAMGEHFHKTADQISAAARRRDRPGVVHALNDTLQTCVSCHESYRQEIIIDAKATEAMDDSCPMMQGK
jgi:cytochrome c556